MNLESYFIGNEAIVDRESYSIVKSKKICEPFLAAIKTENEITLVQRSADVMVDHTLSSENGWRLITFKSVLPFELVGFLSRVTKKMADSEIPVFVLSAFSTDHILVKEEHLASSLWALSNLGIMIEEK